MPTEDEMTLNERRKYLKRHEATLREGEAERAECIVE